MMGTPFEGLSLKTYQNNGILDRLPGKAWLLPGHSVQLAITSGSLFNLPDRLLPHSAYQYGLHLARKTHFTPVRPVLKPMYATL